MLLKLSAAVAALALAAACSSTSDTTPTPSPVASSEASPVAAATSTPPPATPTPDPIQHRRTDPSRVAPGEVYFSGGIVGIGDFTAGTSPIYSARNALAHWGGEEFAESKFVGQVSEPRLLLGSEFEELWPDTCLGLSSARYDCIETDAPAFGVYEAGGNSANTYGLRIADGSPTYAAWLPERVVQVRFLGSEDGAVMLELSPGGQQFTAELVPGSSVQLAVPDGATGWLGTAAIVPPPGRDGVVLLSLASSRPGDIPQVDFERAGERATEALIDWLELPETTRTNVVTVEQVTWPDGCRGIDRPRVGCTSIPRDGVRVTVQVNDHFEYVVHADVDGGDPVLAADSEMWVRLGPCCDNDPTSLSVLQDDGPVLMPWRRVFSGTATSGLDFLAYGEPVLVRLVADPDGEGMVIVSLDHVPRSVRDQYDERGDRPVIDPIAAPAGVGVTSGIVQTLPGTQPSLPPVGRSLWEDVNHAVASWGPGIMSGLGAGFGDPVAQRWPDACLGVRSPGVECAPGEVVAYEQLVRGFDSTTEYRFRVSESLPVIVAWLADRTVEGELVSIRLVDDRQREVTLRTAADELLVALTSVEARMSEHLEPGDVVRAGLVPRADAGEPRWGLLTLERVED
jgi:hypothetical protein